MGVFVFIEPQTKDFLDRVLTGFQSYARVFTVDVDHVCFTWFRSIRHQRSLSSLYNLIFQQWTIEDIYLARFPNGTLASHIA